MASPVYFLDDDSKLERRAWSRREDEAILRLVAQYGTKSWTIIAQELKKEIEGSCRTGKQCRTR